MNRNNLAKTPAKTKTTKVIFNRTRVARENSDG